jgi:hypothetical protein
MWARVENGKVMETTDIDPKGRFVPEIEKQFKPCESNVQPNWLYDGVIFSAPPQRTLDEAKAAKLAELDQAAANAYISGFYSEASGTKLYYDSDDKTQNFLAAVLQFTQAADWGTKVRYPGVAPAGKAPVRARPTATDPESAKTIQLLDADQVKTLVDDMAASFWDVKLTLWGLQTKVDDAEDEATVVAVVWPNV